MLISNSNGWNCAWVLVIQSSLISTDNKKKDKFTSSIGCRRRILLSTIKKINKILTLFNKLPRVASRVRSALGTLLGLLFRLLVCLCRGHVGGQQLLLLFKVFRILQNVAMLQCGNVAMLKCCNVAMLLQYCKVAMLQMLQCCNAAKLQCCNDVAICAILQCCNVVAICAMLQCRTRGNHQRGVKKSSSSLGHF